MNTQDQTIVGNTTTVGSLYHADKPRGIAIWGVLAKYLSLPVLFFAGVAVLNFWSLMHFPTPFVDEAWYANRTYAQIQTGFGFGALDAGIPDKVAGYWTVLAWVQPLVESIPIRLFGLSLFAVRLESLVFGLALLLVIYAVVKRLYSSRAAFITMAVGAFSAGFLFSSHMARPDIQIALCGFGAIALYVYDRSSGLAPKSVLSGLIIGLAIDIHLNIVLFIPVMLGLFFLDFKWRMFRTGRFWGFATGLSMGLAFYIAIHILPYPASYAEINRLEMGLSQTPTILRPRLDILWGMIKGTGYLLGIYTLPLLVGAIWMLVKRRTHSDKRLLIIFGTLLVSFVAFRSYPADYYMIILAPPAWLLIGALIEYLISQPWKRTLWVYARTIAVTSLLFISSLYPVAQLFYDPGDDWQITLSHVQETIPANSMVIGQQNWWLARPTLPYMSWEQLGYYRRYAPGHTLEDAFRALGPEYLIMDPVTDGYLVDNLPAIYYDYFSYVFLRSDVQNFIQEHCTLVSTVTTRTFGTVRIYKIVW